MSTSKEWRINIIKNTKKDSEKKHMKDLSEEKKSSEEHRGAHFQEKASASVLMFRFTLAS